MSVISQPSVQRVTFGKDVKGPSLDENDPMKDSAITGQNKNKYSVKPAGQIGVPQKKVIKQEVTPPKNKKKDPSAIKVRKIKNTKAKPTIEVKTVLRLDGADKESSPDALEDSTIHSISKKIKSRNKLISKGKKNGEKKKDSYTDEQNERPTSSRNKTNIDYQNNQNGPQEFKKPEDGDSSKPKKVKIPQVKSKKNNNKVYTWMLKPIPEYKKVPDYMPFGFENLKRGEEPTLKVLKISNNQDGAVGENGNEVFQQGDPSEQVVANMALMNSNHQNVLNLSGKGAEGAEMSKKDLKISLVKNPDAQMQMIYNDEAQQENMMASMKIEPKRKIKIKATKPKVIKNPNLVNNNYGDNNGESSSEEYESAEYRTPEGDRESVYTSSENEPMSDNSTSSHRNGKKSKNSNKGTGKNSNLKSEIRDSHREEKRNISASKKNQIKSKGKSSKKSKKDKSRKKSSKREATETDSDHSGYSDDSSHIAESRRNRNSENIRNPKIRRMGELEPSSPGSIGSSFLEVGEKAFSSIAVSAKNKKSKTFLFNTPLGEYELIKNLGQGSYGKVKLMRNTLTQVEYAVKIIKRYSSSKHKQGHPSYNKAKTLDRRILREVNLSKILGEMHPHIISLYDFRMTEKNFYLFYEYINGPTLSERIGSNGVSEEEARLLFRPIADAISYCHSYSIIHRDLKLENLLIDYTTEAKTEVESSKMFKNKTEAPELGSNGNGDDKNATECENMSPIHIGNVKLIDFGLANFYSKKGIMETFCGSLPYTAPEILRGEYYNGPEIDIWSLGVLLYVMVTGKFPFSDPSIPENFNKIMEGDFELEKRMSLELKKLLVMMLEPDIKKRLTIKQVLDHKWIQIPDLQSPEDFICCELHPNRKDEIENLAHVNGLIELDYPIKINVAKETSICLEIPIEEILLKINSAIVEDADSETEAKLILHKKNKTVPASGSKVISNRNTPGSMRNVCGREIKKRVKAVNSPVVSLYYLIDSQIQKRKWLTNPCDFYCDNLTVSRINLPEEEENNLTPICDEKNKSKPVVNSPTEVSSSRAMKSRNSSFKGSKVFNITPVSKREGKFFSSVPNLVGYESEIKAACLTGKGKAGLRNSEHNMLKISRFFNKNLFGIEKKYYSESLHNVDIEQEPGSPLKEEMIFADIDGDNKDQRIQELNPDLRVSEYALNRKSSIEAFDYENNMNESKYSLVSMFGLSAKKKSDIISPDTKSKLDKVKKNFLEYNGVQIRTIKALDGVSNRIVLSEKFKKSSPIEIMSKIENLLKNNQISYKYADYILYPNLDQKASGKNGNFNKNSESEFQNDFDFLGPLWKSQAELNRSAANLSIYDQSEKDSDLLRLMLISEENEYLDFKSLSIKDKIKSISSLLLPKAINSNKAFNKKSNLVSTDKSNARVTRSPNSPNQKIVRVGNKRRSSRILNRSGAVLKSKYGPVKNHHQNSIPEGYVWVNKWVRGKNRVVMAHVSELDSSDDDDNNVEISKTISKFSNKFISLVKPNKKGDAKEEISMAEKSGMIGSLANRTDIENGIQKVIMVPVSYYTTQLIGQISPSLNFKKESEVMEHYSCSFKLELVLIQSAGFYKRYAIIVTRTSGHKNKFNLFQTFLSRMLKSI
ncbi:Serine/threonine protein kinase KIN1 [Smittium culicis]|uniref:Serine/threonine protein kinase KIN1 n=1 Tax=Smittium culicis TaxID=133412 RepID=A0A1R1X1G3_9FUNG|nr:Serine/threonine protein kinase KIN1 [Smittium culicis]